MQSALVSAERRSVWSLLKAAVAGEQKDFTTGSLNMSLFMLAVPMVLEMLMESLFAVVDAFYVSRVGIDALTTVALTEAVMMLVYSIAIGLSMSATAFVARRTGEKNLKEAATSAVQAIYLALLVSIPISVRNYLCAGHPPIDGRERVGDCGRKELYPHNAGWKHRDHAFVPEQRGFPRGRGRQHRHARFMAGEYPQHDSRSAFHLWARPVSGARCDRRSCGDHDRARNRRALPNVDVFEPALAHSHPSGQHYFPAKDYY